MLKSANMKVCFGAEIMKYEMIAASVDTAPVYSSSLLRFMVLDHFYLWLEIRKSQTKPMTGWNTRACLPLVVPCDALDAFSPLAPPPPPQDSIPKK